MLNPKTLSYAASSNLENIPEKLRETTFIQQTVINNCLLGESAIPLPQQLSLSEETVRNRVYNTLLTWAGK